MGKRLVTKSQQYFPTDPSRMVEYIKADIKPQAQEEVEQGAEEIPRGPEVNRRSEEELIEAEERHDPANRWGGKKSLIGSRHISPSSRMIHGNYLDFIEFCLNVQYN